MVSPPNTAIIFCGFSRFRRFADRKPHTDSQWISQQEQDPDDVSSFLMKGVTSSHGLIAETISDTVLLYSCQALMATKGTGRIW